MTDITTVSVQWRRASVSVALAMVAVLTASGCGAVFRAVTRAIHDIDANRARMALFTHGLRSGPTRFEATYVTTGANPTTVVYAVRPPDGLSFTEISSGSSGGMASLDIIVNPSGEYYCTPPTSGAAGPSCTKLPKASAADYTNILDFYTPAHWVTFLQDFALAAGFAGDKVTTSRKTVNGFAMSCVDFTPPGVGTSTICTTTHHILGYVSVAGNATSFEITKWSTSPPTSFRLPPNATVTTVTLPPTSTTTGG